MYAGTLAIGLLLHRIFPVKFLSNFSARLLGAACIGLSGLIVSQAFREMRRANTSINPSLPSTALVTEGPYRFTRNPIYLSLTLLYTGIGLLANSLWAMLLLPVLIQIINRGVIEREERYLETTFGKRYRDYASRVGRWL